MSKRKKRTASTASKPRRQSRSGSPWPDGRPPELGHVELAALAVWHTLRAELGRKPEPYEVAARLGVRDAGPYLATLSRLGLLVTLRPQQRNCLRAIAALEARLGGSPSTREVSAEMGLSPAGSRFHIAGLVRLGLVTPPEVRLVLSVTPAGRAFVPRGSSPPPT